MSANYYIMMDGQVFGPYSYNEVLNLGILSDTMLCTEDADSRWKPAKDYAEFRNLFIFSQPQRPQSVSQQEDTTVFIPTTADNTDNSRRAPIIEFAPIDAGEQDDVEDLDVDEDSDNYEVPIENYQHLLLYKQKRKAALIGVLTLGLAGLAVVGVGNTWRGNIFSGTSFDKGGMGFVFKILSFMILSVIVAVPFFIISLIQLIYYSAKISSLR